MTTRPMNLISHRLARQARSRPTPDDSWSALQVLTEGRYRACLANGGHRPSGRITERLGYAAPLMVCAACEVPFAWQPWRRKATR